MNSEFITQLEPQELPVPLEKTEPLAVIKYERPVSEIVEITIDDILDSSESEEENIPDIKDVDIVLHPLCQDSIKIETVPTIILEAVKTNVYTETESAHFMKIQNNVTESENLNKAEDTRDGNGSKATEGVAKIEGNLVTYKQHVLKISNHINCISARSRKPKHSKKTESHRTDENTSWKEIKEKIKIIKAPNIPVEPHEYTSLAKDHHTCNHCQHASKTLSELKRHIKRIHRKTVKMHQCPYCPHKTKWCIRRHIILKHKDIKNIECFRYRCDLCDYETIVRQSMQRHKLNHLKPEEIQYFYCYHCSYKSKQKGHLKTHIAGHFKNGETKPKKKYSCDQCGYKSSRPATIKAHKIIHLKPEESQYFYCNHCSFKSRHKSCVKKHIFKSHYKNVEIKQKRFSCDHCDFKTHLRATLKKHNLIHVKPEDIQYFYCSHCSFKTKHKDNLRTHILRHFIKEEVKFHCYICDFMTFKRKSIIGHIKKHSKGGNKSKINKGS